MRLLTIALSLTVLAACDEIGAPQQGRSKPAQEFATAAQLTSVEQKVVDVEGKIKTLQRDAFLLSMRTGDLEPKGAELTTEPGYSILRNAFGIFPVTYDKAVQYLDGHKVYISIGNPTNITFSGAKIELEYGKPMPKTPDGKIDFDKYAEYTAGRKTQATSVTKEFQAGWYTQIEITVTPSRPEEMRELTLKADFNEMRLKRLKDPAP